jgi:hypothetical protein
MRSGSDEIAAPATPALAPDAILVHIGMHKTGTTAMQSLFGANRAELGQLGITYPGKADWHHSATKSMMGRPIGRSASGPIPADIRRWERVVNEARRSTGRVVISSEYLSHCTDKQAQSLAADLGRERVHIIVGVRNLAPLALSAWQQNLKIGNTLDVDTWLKAYLRSADSRGRPGKFWTVQDPKATVARWARAVGPDRLTVVVIDESDRSLLPRTFEQLLDLPAGMFTKSQARMTNRGMTAAEAEMVRLVNAAVLDKITSPQYISLMRYGAIRRLVEVRATTVGEARLELPAWVVEIAVEEGRKLAAATVESGARIVGSLDSLTAIPAGYGAEQASAKPDAVPLQAAVEAIVGVIGGATGRSWSLEKSPAALGQAKPRKVALNLDKVPTRTLVDVVKTRMKAALRQRLRSLVHR